jgi:hypothetical protein
LLTSDELTRPTTTTAAPKKAQDNPLATNKSVLVTDAVQLCGHALLDNRPTGKTNSGKVRNFLSPLSYISFMLSSSSFPFIPICFFALSCSFNVFVCFIVVFQCIRLLHRGLSMYSFASSWSFNVFVDFSRTEMV